MVVATHVNCRAASPGTSLTLLQALSFQGDETTSLASAVSSAGAFLGVWELQVGPTDRASRTGDLVTPGSVGPGSRSPADLVPVEG